MTHRCAVPETRLDHAYLLDGRSVTVRRSTAADRPAVAALFAGTSEANLYTRFFTVGRSVGETHVEQIFDDADPPLSFVVVDGDRVLGIAEVERESPDTAEIAFLVDDDMHGAGIATLLLERAAAEARAEGILWFVADVLAVNHPMLEVFADAGFRLERHDDRSDVSLRMSTEQTAAAAAATAARLVEARARRRR